MDRVYLKAKEIPKFLKNGLFSLIEDIIIEVFTMEKIIKFNENYTEQFDDNRILFHCDINMGREHILPDRGEHGPEDTLYDPVLSNYVNEIVEKIPEYMQVMTEKITPTFTPELLENYTGGIEYLIKTLQIKIPTFVFNMGLVGEVNSPPIYVGVNFDIIISIEDLETLAVGTSTYNRIKYSNM